jgi:hypothetical protein
MAMVYAKAIGVDSTFAAVIIPAVGNPGNFGRNG